MKRVLIISLMTFGFMAFSTVVNVPKKRVVIEGLWASTGNYGY